MAEILIQGINCTYRDLKPDEEVLYKDLPQEDQYFRRIEIPFVDEELAEIAEVEYDLRKGKYNKVQAQWVEREEKRMTYGEGVYAMINGNLTYIPASYWGYINHWVLEHGEKPEYREADRIFFLFMEYVAFETNVLGITRGKGRRQGATSLGFYWMWWICGRLPEKRGGSISFNDEAAKKNFQAMFMRGFKGMLPCFVRDFDSKAENFMRFIKPQGKVAKGVNLKREGLNSYCDYLSATLNSYDSGRLSFGLFDETGKLEKMNINSYWSKVSPTLKTGKKKVGFAYMPTTVNPKNKGGENYKQFWKEADQNAIDPNTGQPYGLDTMHRVVRYFVPAYEGYAGCIDKFGNSVIDDPETPVMGNDGEWITQGAKTIILEERARKEGEQLMEHRRDFPLDEYDMFSFESGMCEFNEKRIRTQIEEIETNKEKYFLRRIRLIREESYTKMEGTSVQIRKLEIKYADDPKGDWYLFEEPEKPNKFDIGANYVHPRNELAYTIGVDTFKDEFAFSGSKGTICVMKRSKIVNGEQVGLYPVAMFVGRPRLLVHLYDEVLKACLWFGTKANFELDAGTQYYNYFVERGANTFLQWTPKIAIDPIKAGDKKIKPGTQSADPFALQAQLEYCKKYIDGDIPGGYNGHVHKIVFPELLQQLIDYNHSARTPYDQVISLMMAILPMMGTLDITETPKYKPKAILPKYAIKIPA